MSIARSQFPALPDPLPGHPWFALIQADDSARDAHLGELLEAALSSAIENRLVVDAVVAQSEGQARELWDLREHIPEAQRLEGPNIKHDISVPVSRIAEFLDRCGRELDAALPGVRYVTFGHLGDGNLHYNLSAPAGVSTERFTEETERANRIVYDVVDALGGSFSAEHGIGQMKRDELRRYKPALDVELMQTLKRALDPYGILNPGKVV